MKIRYILILVGVLIIDFKVFSQGRDKIILADNSTLSGTVIDIYQSEIWFKSDSSKRSIVYNADQVPHFYINSDESYISIVSEENKMFVQEVIDGFLNLYYSNGNYWVSKDSTPGYIKLK